MKIWAHRSRGWRVIWRSYTTESRAVIGCQYIYFKTQSKHSLQVSQLPREMKKNLSVRKLVTSQTKKAGASQRHRGNSESQSYTIWDVFDVFSLYSWRSLEISALCPFLFCRFWGWGRVGCDGHYLPCRGSSPVIWTQILSVEENADSPYFLSYSKRIIKSFPPRSSWELGED